MAKYENQEIPAVQKKYKIVPSTIEINGFEMDEGKCSVRVVTTKREVNDNNEPIKDEDGNYVYNYQFEDCGMNVTPEAMNIKIDGITLAQVFDWIGKFIDQQFLNSDN